MENNKQTSAGSGAFRNMFMNGWSRKGVWSLTRKEFHEVERLVTGSGWLSLAQTD
jgi:hypothetical protein